MIDGPCAVLATGSILDKKEGVRCPTRKALAFAAATAVFVAVLAAPASAAGTPTAVTPQCRAGKVVIGFEGRP
jgi:hypothetical protein